MRTKHLDAYFKTWKLELLLNSLARPRGVTANCTATFFFHVFCYNTRSWVLFY